MGAVVLVAIAVIFVPTFLRDRQVEPVSTKTLIPDRPSRETVTFDNPEPPENIEPAPEPDAMFMPETSSPPAEGEEPEEATAEVSSAPETRVNEPEEAPAPQGEEPESQTQEGEGRRDAAEQVPAEADTAQNQAADGQAWVIQVASLRSADSARDLRDKLQKQGYRAYVRSASTSAGEVSRVFIGPKISRSEAETTKAEVDKALKVDALIMRFEP